MFPNSRLKALSWKVGTYKSSICSHTPTVSSGAKCYIKVPRLSRSNIFLDLFMFTHTRLSYGKLFRSNIFRHKFNVFSTSNPIDRTGLYDLF